MDILRAYHFSMMHLCLLQSSVLLVKGQYPPKRRIPGIRRSLQAFMAETPAFEQEEPAPQDHVAIEMTEPPRRSQEPRGNTRQAGNIDEKVEFKSQSPRYYRPESPQPESNSQGQPRGWRDAPPAKSRKTLPTLPSSNIALEQLVAKWTPRPKPDINRLGQTLPELHFCLSHRDTKPANCTCPCDVITSWSRAIIVALHLGFTVAL